MAAGAEWTQHGGDIKNSRFQGDEDAISADTVSQLELKWMFATSGDVTGTPTVDDGKVYVADWAGWVHRIDSATGTADWSVLLSDSTGFDGDFARSSISVAGGYVIVGNQAGRTGQGGAKLVALNKETGAMVWVTQLDPSPFSIVTMAPTVYRGMAYVGVASFEELYAAFIPEVFFPCCLDRGSVVAVNVGTGAIEWQTYMAPEYDYSPDSDLGPFPAVGVGANSPPRLGGDGRFSGNGVWGSAPAIDRKRNQLYVATGNNYSAPDSYHTCIAAAADDDAALACNDPENYFDSVVALDLDTGAVQWGTHAYAYDTWNVACAAYLIGGTIPGTEANCAYDAYLAGPDFDFAQAPILASVRGKDYVGAGQKSGIYWSFDPDTGSVNWDVRTGPGGLAGGHQWGSASDGSTIYTSNANSFGAPYVLIDGTGTSAGIFSAIDSRTGTTLWQTANPGAAPAGAPAAVANDVMFACGGEGTYYALDTADGSVLWTYFSGAPCGASGASIVDGTVYWGTGYTQGFGGPPLGAVGISAFGLPE